MGSKVCIYKNYYENYYENVPVGSNRQKHEKQNQIQIFMKTS